MPLTDEQKRKDAEDLRKQQEAVKHDSGMFGNIFRRDKVFPLWDPATGTNHSFDIVPYFLTENHPMVKNGEAQPGQRGYILPVHVHSNVGTTQDKVICLAKTLHKRCVVCEEGKKQLDRIDRNNDAEFSAWRSKYGTSLRDIYNVVVCTTGADVDKGVQVLEISDAYMEKELKKLTNSSREGHRSYAFYGDTGYTVTFTREADQMKKCSGHILEKRIYEGKPYGMEEYMDAAYTLEDLVFWPTEKEVEEMFWAGEDAAPVLQATARGVQAEDSGRFRGQRGSQQQEGSQRGSGQVGDGKCPGGGVFGVDINTLACNECGIYNDCAGEYERKKDEAEAAGGGRGGRYAQAGEGQQRYAAAGEPAKSEPPAAQPSSDTGTARRRRA